MYGLAAKVQNHLKKWKRKLKNEIMKLLLMLCLFTYSASAQTFKLKEHKTALALTFTSGLFDGVRDASMFGRMDNMGKFFWRHSWKNKYKNGNVSQGPAFFGSTTAFVMFTDAPHAANSVGSILDGVALTYVPPMKYKTFGKRLLVAGAYILAKNIGHNLIYSVVFKQR